MGLFDNYRIKKAIDTLFSTQNSASPEVAQAAQKLKHIGPSAFPKLIEALGAGRNYETIVSVLAAMIQNDTLPMYIDALTNAPSQRVEVGILEALARGDKYDPNKLLGLFTNPKISREHLEKILIAQKHKLHPDALLRLLTTTNKNEHEAIFRLLNQVATEAVVPELIPRLRTDDGSLRYSIVRTLCRFKTSAVQHALLKLLTDPHKDIRFLALQSLVTMREPLDMETLCPLLRDPETKIQEKALDVLLENLQHESEEMRRSAVVGLSATGDVGVMRNVFTALKDKDWRCTVRVADTLGTFGGVSIVEMVLALLKDKDVSTRQCALEIFQKMKNERTFILLVEALKDKESREHAVEALAAMGDKRAVPVFIKMLEEDSETSLSAIRALVVFREPHAIPSLLTQLQRQDKVIRQEVLQALTVLTNEEYAPYVMQMVMSMRGSDDEELRQLTNRIATDLIKRFGQKVMPRRTVIGVTDEASAAHQEVLEVTVVSDTPRIPNDIASQPRLTSGVQRSTQVIDVTALEPGVVLGERYRVIRCVGQGGFSTVFLVEDTMVHEEVILKILNSQVAFDSNMIKRFIHELRYARKVTHENVIRIYDFTPLGQSYAISMEYFPGHSLDKEIKELQDGKSLNVKRSLKIIWDVCRGVSAAHQVSVVHRDLKPPNILINDQGVVKIVDFGVAAVTSDMSTRLTRVGTIIGTPTYMAPEQVRSRGIDARTDIYSLGVIMYELFTGRPPYTGDEMAVLFQHVEGNPVPPRQTNPELPPALEEMILKAMAVDPEQRFQSVDELRKNLMGFIRQR
jgi:HEAT repeat protein/tRNA A-37 threonylcarbamoyl transferase component Bud32